MKLTPLKIFLILLLSVLIPFVFIGVSVFAVPPVYDETFLGELSAKYALLKETDEPKIVVIGGSSAAFGLDSTLIGEAVGRPVVNFGLYATLGTKMMLDLSRANIGKGDTVILAPELDEQTLSLYFNATSAWQAIDSDPSMLLRVGFRNGSELLGGVVEYLGKKFEYSLAGRKVTQTGVYSRSSFNESGDIVYPRPYNVMTFGYDRSTEIRLEPDIFSEEFIEYVNRYISWARRRGAEVYFAFCPMNRDALAPGTTDDSVYEFVEFIEENLIKDLLRSVDMEMLAEQMGSYFDAFLDHLPDNETDLYIMVESIGRAFEGLIFDDMSDADISELAGEIVKFRKWYVHDLNAFNKLNG